MTPFLPGHTFQNGEAQQAELGRLTCFKFLHDIVNIAKIQRQYSWDVRGWCGDKKEGIFLSVDTPREKNKSLSNIQSRPSVGWFHGQSQ